MAREKQTYRDNLESLRAAYPGREQITLSEAASYLGVSRRRVASDETFPRRRLGNQDIVVLVNFARWLAV